MMKLARNPYVVGFLIFIITAGIFFVLNIFFRDVNYYRNTMIVAAFVAPLLSGVGAFLSVYYQGRTKRKVSFRDAYGRAFVPMFVGGILTTATMFAYINYIDKDTKQLLNYQFIESFKQSLEDEYQKAKKIVIPNSEEDKELEQKYANAKVRIAAKEAKNEDIFTAKNFGYVFAGYCAFYLLLSLFFGSFFRTRNPS